MQPPLWPGASHPGPFWLEGKESSQARAPFLSGQRPQTPVPTHSVASTEGQVDAPPLPSFEPPAIPHPHLATHLVAPKLPFAEMTKIQYPSLCLSPPAIDLSHACRVCMCVLWGALESMLEPQVWQ